MPTTVTNYADVDLLVVLEKPNGEKERRPLRTRHTTPSNVKVIGIMSSGGNRIRGYEYGWLIDPDTEIYVHKGVSGFLSSYVELDMHCIPDRVSKILQQSQKAPKEIFSSIPVIKDDESHSWGIPVSSTPPISELGIQEVELDSTRNPLYLNNKYRYIRTGRYFSVRIQLVPVGKFKFFNLEQMKKFVKKIVGALILWNSYPTIENPSDRLRFHIEVVKEQPDISIKLFPRLSDLPKKQENTRNWSLESLWTTIAHEFGHYLGLIDEYAYGKPNGYLAEKKDYWFRAWERKGNRCTKPENLMEKSRIANPLVDSVLIDSIKQGKSLQTLCCRNNQDCM